MDLCVGAPPLCAVSLAYSRSRRSLGPSGTNNSLDFNPLGYAAQAAVAGAD